MSQRTPKSYIPCKRGSLVIMRARATENAAYLVLTRRGDKLTRNHVRVLEAERKAIDLYAAGRLMLKGIVREQYIARLAGMSVFEMRVYLDDATRIMERMERQAKR